MSIQFSSLVKKVFAYDIAAENIKYCNKKHDISNVSFEHDYIEKVNNQQINKMFLGAVFQYFSKGQLENFKNAISSKKQFNKLSMIYISHIPDINKQFDWIDGYRNLILNKNKLYKLQETLKNYNTWYNSNELIELFNNNFNVEVLNINKNIPQHKYCFDLLLLRK